MKKQLSLISWAILALLVSVAPVSAQTLFSGHVETSEGTPVYGMLVLAYRADVSSTAIQVTWAVFHAVIGNWPAFRRLTTRPRTP